MAELHLVVPDSYIREVRGFLQTINGNKTEVSVTDIGREALGVYRWYLDELSRGNAVASVSGGDTSALAPTPPQIQLQVYTPRTTRPLAKPVDQPPQVDDRDVGPVAGSVF